jgi:hypothetical protein
MKVGCDTMQNEDTSSTVFLNSAAFSSKDPSQQKILGPDPEPRLGGKSFCLSIAAQ